MHFSWQYTIYTVNELINYNIANELYEYERIFECASNRFFNSISNLVIHELEIVKHELSRERSNLLTYLFALSI